MPDAEQRALQSPAATDATAAEPQANHFLTPKGILRFSESELKATVADHKVPDEKRHRTPPNERAELRSNSHVRRRRTP